MYQEHPQCPLCGTALTITDDDTYFTCSECDFSEETMALEQETYTAQAYSYYNQQNQEVKYDH